MTVFASDLCWCQWIKKRWNDLSMIYYSSMNNSIRKTELRLLDIPIDTDVSRNGKVPGGDMQCFKGCQWFAVVVVPYKGLFQQFFSKYLRWHQLKMSTTTTTKNIFVSRHSWEGSIHYKLVDYVNWIWNLSKIENIFAEVSLPLSSNFIGVLKYLETLFRIILRSYFSKKKKK